MQAEHKTKLLLVDDLPENLQVLTKIIEQDDRVIYQARSGEAALSLLLEHEFALAILDVMMPNMNGFELAELMRGTDRTRDIPIIFVSACGKELNYAFRGYESGAVDFLHKPLNIAAVQSKVNVFVSLHQQRYELERQVSALEKTRHTLDQTRLELQQALEMRDDFISIVAHELRTPLNTLHLEIQLRKMLLNKGSMDAFDAAGLKSMVARDDRQIQSMNRLINDMIDVSRIQNGELSIESDKVDLHKLLERVVSDLSQQAKAAGCDINLSIKRHVNGHWDEIRIEQIIINLLTNAFRHCAGKPVEVSLDVDQNDVTIEVQDQGMGIAYEDQPRIFEKFERGPTERDRDGLGMGLYIARQLAEAQQGTLNVESSPGEGARFILKLSNAAEPLP